MHRYWLSRIAALRGILVDRPADRVKNVPSASAQTDLTAAQPMIVGCRRSVFRSLLLWGLLLATPWQAVGANLHSFSPIRNTAFMSFDGGTSQLVSNTVEVVPRSVASIEFLKYAPREESGGEAVHVPPTDYDQGGNQFTAVMPVLDQTVPLLGSPNYYLGETIYVRLTDLDQNLDATLADKIIVTVTCTETGDSEVLRLTETGPETGIFAGYLPTASEAAAGANGMLLVVEDCHLQASYTDPLDQVQTVTDAALIDPYGIVFDSLSGEPIDGAVVTLLNVATASPAMVYGDDGVSRYPATVVTGGTVTDAGGQSYQFPPGGFRFPYVLPGTYRLEVAAPSGYVVPSSASDAQLLSVRPEAALETGSRGEPFAVDPGPALRLDVPADPLTSYLWLQKFVSDDLATIGDFLQYRLELENHHTATTAPAVSISDYLPLGFRYQSGSSRLNGARVADPAISADGRTLIFQLGDLPPKGKSEVTYAVEVAAGARTGAATNQAQAHDRSDVRSNVARATVEIKEVFFRDQAFLLGRVLTGSCSQEDTEMPGLQGVRIYLEDGTFVVTDRDGKYHFEGIEPGTHVVQVDLATLPPGFALIDCEDASQSAGRGFSRFVDLKGGTLWQVNFHAAPLPATASPPSADNAGQQEPSAPVQGAAAPERVTGLLSPLSGTAVSRIEEVRIRLDANLKPRLSLDRQEISENRIGLRMLEPETGTILYSYIGVDFGGPGTRQLLVEGLDPFGNARFRQEAVLIRTGEIAGMRLLEAPDNRADGKTPVKIRIELIDVAGQVVTSATSVVLEHGELRPLGEDTPSLNAGFETTRQEQRISVDPQGWISFNPVDRSGRYAIRLAADTASLDTDIFVQPQMRDWILVGFADGTVGYNTISDNMVSAEKAGIEEHGYTDGRVKFFAKGAIKGEWLLTLAYDSDKPDLDGDSLQQSIDPDTYYPLYGDGTRQAYEAASASDLYVKLERDQFYALFGDMETGLTQTDLSQYSRSLNGFKSELESERFAYTVFAADTKQGFVKDEIRGDGTAGRYALSQKDLVVNSERVVIETRDRFHPELILNEEPLSRYVDYDIDYDDGTLYFKRPIPSKDGNFNPVFVVARYETQSSDEAHLNYGGRVAARFRDQQVEVGASHIHEENGSDEGDLYGADLTLQLTPQTVLHAEAATTESEALDEDARQGDAWLAEIVHTGEQVSARGYVREQEADFGLGQQNTGENGTRTYGIDGVYHLTPRWSLAGEAYRQENLETVAKRDVGQLEASYRGQGFGLMAGVREARDRFDDGETQRSRQLIAGGDVTLYNHLTLRATHEQSLGSSDENADFPTRTMLGADWQLTRNVSLFAEQEFTWGDREETEGTRIGFKSTPWSGGTLTSAVEREMSENGERLFALFGLGQSWQITSRWSVDFAVDRSYTIKDPGNDRLNVNVPPASGNDDPLATYSGNDDDFTAVSVGATYRAERWSWSNRVETRESDSEDKVGVSSSIVGDLREGLAASASLSTFFTDEAGGISSEEEDLTLGLAWRPAESRWIILERLDLERDRENDDAGADYDSWRVINHLHANYRPDRRWQSSLYYGLKYARESLDGDCYAGFTDMLAVETRYNIDKHWDIGVNGAGLHSWNSAQVDYSAGASVGFLAMANTWISVGYNVAGFEDDDFSAASYTAAGPYVKFRVKFDQQSVQEAVAWLNR